jgi:predicted phosphodiesterase
VELVLFAGDLVSTFAVPPLRKLQAPLVACFGDNEGNKPGLLAGFQLVGKLGEPPLRLTTGDGTIRHTSRCRKWAATRFDDGRSPRSCRRS